MRDINDEIAELQEQLAHARHKVTEIECQLQKLITLSDMSFMEAQFRCYFANYLNME